MFTYQEPPADQLHCIFTYQEPPADQLHCMFTYQEPPADQLHCMFTLKAFVHTRRQYTGSRSILRLSVESGTCLFYFMVCVWGMGYKTHTRRYMLYASHSPIVQYARSTTAVRGWGTSPRYFGHQLRASCRIPAKS
jgi:hypothetical protein